MKGLGFRLTQSREECVMLRSNESGWGEGGRRGVHQQEMLYQCEAPNVYERSIMLRNMQTRMHIELEYIIYIIMYMYPHKFQVNQHT